MVLCVSRFASDVPQVGRQDGDEKWGAFVAKGRRTERVSSTSEVSSEGVPSISNRTTVEWVRVRGHKDAAPTPPLASLGHLRWQTPPLVVIRHSCRPMLNNADGMRALLGDADDDADHRRSLCRRV